MVENYLYFKSANGSPIEMNKNETKKVISKMFWPRKTLNKLIMWLSIDDVSLTFQQLMETWHDFWSMNLQLLDANWQISNDTFAENTGSILRLRSWYFFSISAYCVKVAVPESELCQHMQTIVICTLVLLLCRKLPYCKMFVPDIHPIHPLYTNRVLCGSE